MLDTLQRNLTLCSLRTTESLRKLVHRLGSLILLASVESQRIRSHPPLLADRCLTALGNALALT